jgi:hypothetical protein
MRSAAVAPVPPVADQTPSALLRSAPSSKVVIRIDSAVGAMIAAEIPWTIRAAIRKPPVGANPQASEEIRNRAVPTTNMRRRPSRSARRPPSRSSPPKVSR